MPPGRAADRACDTPPVAVEIEIRQSVERRTEERRSDEQGRERTQDLSLWYDAPAVRWEQALPIGNGFLGAMVFGGIDSERLQLNDSTLWSGPPARTDVVPAAGTLPAIRAAVEEGRFADAGLLSRALQGPYTQGYLPLGDLVLSYRPEGGAPAAHDGSVSDYRRSLDLSTGISRVSCSTADGELARSAFISAVDGVLVHHTALTGHCGTFTIELSSPLRFRTGRGDGVLFGVGKAPVHVDPGYVRTGRDAIRYSDAPGEGMFFAVAVRVVTDPGATVELGEAVETKPAVVTVRRAETVTLLVATATVYRGFGAAPDRSETDCIALATERAGAAADRSVADLTTRHVADHRRLFDRVALDLAAEPATDPAAAPTDQRLRRYRAGHGGDRGLVELLFQYGRYLMIASSRPGSQPSNLQGIWNEHVQAPWSSNYTLNINAEMNYWPAETANLPECHEPFLDFVKELSENGSRTARSTYGLPGWLAHHNSDLWRQSAMVGDHGHGDPTWAGWQFGGAWACRHLWEHYLFGGDVEFLRTSAFPVLRGAAEFCLAWLVDGPAGELTTSPSTSPENEFRAPSGESAAVSSGSTMDLAITRELFSACVAAIDILGGHQNLRARLADALGRLRPPHSGSAGQLLEWSADYPEIDPNHRHLSHLYGLYPGDQITRSGSPELAAAAARSLDIRGDDAPGWGMAWRLCLWARLKDGDRALRLLESSLRLVEDSPVEYVGGGVYANLLSAHPPFQIDGNFGVTAGIVEMLVQSHDGGVDLLPALPAAWPEGRVRGLRVRGGLQMDLTWQQGRLVTSTLTALFDGTHRIRYDGAEHQVSMRTGQVGELGPDLESIAAYLDGQPAAAPGPVEESAAGR